jgi:hypothetical protein
VATAKTLAKIRKEKRKFIGFIGGYLIDAGVLTLEELDRGILQQLRLAEEGQVAKLGEILIDLRYITRADLTNAMQHRASDQAKLKGPSGKKK